MHDLLTFCIASGLIVSGLVIIVSFNMFNYYIHLLLYNKSLVPSMHDCL